MRLVAGEVVSGTVRGIGWFQIPISSELRTAKRTANATPVEIQTAFESGALRAGGGLVAL